MISGAAVLVLAAASAAVPAQSRQPSPRPSAPSIEVLAGQGFEVKAMQPFDGRPGRFVVLMQRAGDVRTCFLRLEARPNTTPARRSACF